MSSHSQIGSSSSMPIDDLTHNVMTGKWDEVVTMYETNPEARKAKVNEDGDTALRAAISARETVIVKKLVNAADKGALEKANNWGDTALHMAAFVGSAKMCSCIVQKEPKLIGNRNKDSETPFFHAVHFGSTKAFLCLHDICGRDLGYIYGRRGGDGETILHTAISRQHYEIAYHIIHLYPEFVHSKNEKGFSPLYLMASTPSAFRSGCPQIRGIHQLVYYGIHVSKLKPRRKYENKRNIRKHQPCIGYISSLMGCSTNLQGQQKDEEGQHADHDHEEEQGPNISKNGSHCRNMLVSAVCSSLQWLYQAISVIFGPGTHTPTKLKETKQKNVWSKQIMKDIVMRSAKFRYKHNGMIPTLSDSVADAKKLQGAINSWENQQLTVGGNATLPIDNSKDNNQKKEENKKSSETSGKEKVSETKAKMETPILVAANNGVIEIEEEVSTIGKTEKVSETMAKTETPILVAAKNGVIEIVEKVSTIGKTEKDFETMAKMETPILVAAKNGVIEIVQEVLEIEHGDTYIAIHDSNRENKNVVLLAAENRKANVYDFLLKQKKMKEAIFSKRDIYGNSALHLAAKLGVGVEPWHVPGPALQMQCEVKWYEFVKSSMAPHFFVWFNKAHKTPDDIFKESHKNLVEDGGDWLNKTSQSFSVVATLIATVAFATSAMVPGGVDDDTGNPVLEKKPAFSIFAISSLIALCFSIMCVIMFLAILTSRYQDVDFGKDLPRKFLVGLTSLFVSITSMLASFCAGHSFVIKEELKYAALPVYAITCLVVTIITIAQFPFYFDLAMISFSKKPWSRKRIN